MSGWSINREQELIHQFVTSPLSEFRNVKTSKTFIFMIVLTALLVRVIFISTIEPKLRFPDSESYTTMGSNFLDGKGLIINEGHKVERMPLYPLFIAGCYKVCDLLGAGTENNHDNPLRILFIRLAQCFVGAITCLLVFFLGKRLFSPLTGQIAALITAIYPFFIFYTGLVLTETLFIALLLATILCLVKLQEKPSVLMSITTGAFWGAAILTRASLLLFLPFVAPFWIIGCPTKKKLAGAGYLLIVALTVGATMTPWVYRNYKLTGHLVITTLMTGPSFYEANSKYADGGPKMDVIPWEKEANGQKLSEYEANVYFKEKAWKYIQKELRENPKKYLRLSLTKLARFWNPTLNDEEYSTISNNLISISSFLPLVLLGLYGFLKTLKKPRVSMILISPILYYSLIHSIFVGSTRYRTPIMPFVIVFASFAVDSILAACYRAKVTPSSAIPPDMLRPEEEKGAAASTNMPKEKVEASVPSTPKWKNGLIKKVGITLINVILVTITLAFIVFTIIVSPYNIKREAEKQLSKYFSGQATIESAGFSLLNGIHLKDIRVTLPTKNGQTDILKIDRVNLDHNIERLSDLKSLIFNKEISIGDVEIYSLELNLSRDREGNWNIEPVFHKPSGGRGTFKPKSVPKIALHSSTLHFKDEYGKEAERLPSFDLTNAKVNLNPLRGREGGFSLIASCKLADLGKLEITGEIYTNTPRANLKVIAENIPISDKIRPYLPKSSQIMWDWFSPNNGVVNVTFKLQYDNSAKTPREMVDYKLVLDFSDCDVVFNKFPYPLMKSRGRLKFTPEGVRIEKFAASNGKAGVKVEGGLEGYGDDAGIDVMIYTHDVPLDNMLKDVLSRSISGFKKVSDFYGFNGGILNVDSWHLTRDKGPDKPINHVIEISFSGCSMNCKAFPYPIKNGRGKLRLTPSSVAIDGIEASNSTGTSKISIGGRLDGYGEDAGIEITVEADIIALDDTLKNALPENIRQLWNFFNLTGTVKNVKWQLTRKKGPEQSPSHFFDASLINGTMRCNAFPYTVSEITSKVIYENGLLLLKNLKGKNNKAEIKIGSPSKQNGEGIIGNVKIDTSQSEPSFDIVIDVRNAQADERLKSALAEKFQEIWDQFKPSGTFNALCEVKRLKPGEAVNVTVYATLLNCSATYAGFAYPLSNITGEVIFRSATSTADLRNIVGRHGNAKITLLDTTVGALSEKNLKISGTAENLMLNDALRGALPVEGREIWEIFDPKGIVDVDWDYTREPGAEQGNYKIATKLRDVDMSYKLTATSKVPIKLANMRGGINFDGDVANLSKVTGRFWDDSIAKFFLPAIIPYNLQLFQFILKNYNDFVALYNEMQGGGIVTLNGEIHNLGKSKQILLNIDARNIQLTDRVKNALPENLRNKWEQLEPVGGRISALIDINWRTALNPSEREIAYSAKITLNKCNLTVEVPVTNINGEIDVKNGKIMGEKPLEAKGYFDLRDFAVQGVRFGKLYAKFDKKGPNLKVSEFDFGIHSGTGVGSVNFTFLDNGDIEYKAKFNVENVDVGDIVKSAKLPYKKLKGTLNARTEFKGRGLDKESLESPGSSFEIKNGDISDLRKRTALPSVAKAIKFNGVEVKYKIERDKVKANTLNLIGPMLSLYGKGKMDKDGNLDFRFHPKPHGGPKLPIIGLIMDWVRDNTVRVILKGNLNDPTWRVDPLFPLTQLIRGFASLFSSGKNVKKNKRKG